MSFDLFMNNTCRKCHKPLNSAAIEPHATRRDPAVHKFVCASCGTLKAKILLRKKRKPLPDELAA
jgi:RNase P subunit RPR2